MVHMLLVNSGKMLSDFSQIKLKIKLVLEMAM